MFHISNAYVDENDLRLLYFFFVTYQWNAEILSQFFKSTQNQNDFSELLIIIILPLFVLYFFLSFLLSSNGFLWKRQKRITNHCV